MAKHRIDGGMRARAVWLQRIERAGGGEAFEHALVDGARIDAAREIDEVAERLRPARSDNRFHRLRADAFERRQRVTDGALLDLELHARVIDRRRLHLDAEALGLGAEFRELVGVVHGERHRRRQELHRIVRLHVGGLVGDHRIRGSVALVEAVVGEPRQQFENGIGLRALDAALDRAGDEALALRLHLLLDLLAHGAAQQVRFAERVAGQDLRRLHHLFLVDDDAERFAQDRLELRMDVFRLLVAVLARAVGRDVGHRAGAVERDQRDDVLEPVGAHVDERAPHAGAFHLEHADHLAARQHLVRFWIVERDAQQIDLDAAPLHQLDRDVEHRQRREAEEVELHQACLLDPLHVELGHRHVGFRIAVKRDELRQRPVADHDAGGMGGGVTVEPFEPNRNGERARHDRLAVAHRLQPRLFVDRALERDRRGRILRHQLAELVDLPVRHFEHAADVAQHAARLQRSEGDDLRHLVAAVTLLHVSDHLVAAGPGRSRCRSPASTRARD